MYEWMQVSWITLHTHTPHSHTWLIKCWKKKKKRLVPAKKKKKIKLKKWINEWRLMRLSHFNTFNRTREQTIKCNLGARTWMQINGLMKAEKCWYLWQWESGSASLHTTLTHKFKRSTKCNLDENKQIDEIGSQRRYFLGNKLTNDMNERSTRAVSHITLPPLSNYKIMKKTEIRPLYNYFENLWEGCWWSCGKKLIDERRKWVVYSHTSPCNFTKQQTWKGRKILHYQIGTQKSGKRMGLKGKEILEIKEVRGAEFPS